MWKMEDVDMVEIYSPPRVVLAAAMYGLKPGESMDLTNGWDFTLARHREAAERYIRLTKPKLVIGSPECRMFSALQNLRKWGQKAEEELTEAKEHLKFVAKIYMMQISEGRWFLHEHPAGATSWQLDVIKDVEKQTGAVINVADLCMYGMETRGAGWKRCQPGKGPSS